MGRLSVICYPQPGKARSREVLSAFAAGCGGRVQLGPLERLEGGAAAFYGHLGLDRLVAQARGSGRDWYYGDNAFFDRARGRYYRFARNAFQISHLAPPDHGRLKALGVEVKPWQVGSGQAGGGHIVIAEQSEAFLRMSGAGDRWFENTVDELRRHTDRPLRFRRWPRDKEKACALLPGDLAGAWALVTHSSAAAVGALLAGVPVFCTGPCGATPMASGPLAAIEAPLRPDGREDWAAGLAGMQWTEEEIRAGLAWRALTTYANLA